MFGAIGFQGERNIDFALRRAIFDEDPRRVGEALKRGADPNASIGGDVDYAPLLEAARSSAKHRNKNGLLIVGALLAAGARIDARSVRGETALHRAATAGWPQAVEALLAAGADPGAVDQDGQTPLHCAALRRPGWEISTQAIGLLLTAGTDVNAVNKLRLSALHCAAACAHATGIQLLLAAGADPLAAAADGRSAAAFVENAAHAQKSEKTAAVSELNLAALVANAAKASEMERRESEITWEIDRFLSDKTHSSHDYLRVSDKVVAIPGGQKSPSIDSLSIAAISGDDEFFKDVAAGLNAGNFLLFGGEPALLNAAAEPGMEGLAITWESLRGEGGMWQEYCVREKRFAIALPMRGIDEAGRMAPFILFGEGSYDVAEGAKGKKKGEAIVPKLAWLESMNWAMAKKAADLWALTSKKQSHLWGLLVEADKCWVFDKFLNPRRIEAEEIASSTPKAPAKKRLSL